MDRAGGRWGPGQAVALVLLCCWLALQGLTAAAAEVAPAATLGIADRDATAETDPRLAVLTRQRAPVLDAPRRRRAFGAGDRAATSDSGPFDPAAEPLAAGDPLLAETPEVRFTGAIRSLARRLGHDPLRMFDHVRNQLDFEPHYVGSLKGAQETLIQGAGNDYDLASLLVALYRVSGIPAGYVAGTAWLPIAKAKAWLGVSDAQTAADILATAGYDVAAIARGGRIVALEVPRVWVEAFVPVGDRTQRIQLDPAFKRLEVVKGVNISREAGIDPANFLERVIGESGSDPAVPVLDRLSLDTIGELLDANRRQLVRHLERRRPNASLGRIVGSATIIPQTSARLPSGRPFQIIGAPVRFAAIPTRLRHYVRVDIAGAGIDQLLALPEIAGQRVTISFVPASPEDAAEIEAAGSLLDVRFGLGVAAELRVGGRVVARGQTQRLGFADQLAVDFLVGQEVVRSVSHFGYTVGGLYAIALDTQRVTRSHVESSLERLRAARQAAGADALREDVLGEMLHLMGLIYFGYQERTARYLAGTDHAVAFHQLNEALVSLPIAVEGFGVRLDGFRIDNQRNDLVAFARDGRASFDPAALSFAFDYASSAWEEALLRRTTGIPSISTTTFFQEAAQNDVPIYAVDTTNLNQILPLLDPSITRSFRLVPISQALGRGLTVLLPQREMKLLDWQGLAWVEIDRATGQAFFVIGGRYAGGWSTLSFRGLSSEEQQKLLQDAFRILEAFADGFVLGDFDRRVYDQPALFWANLSGRAASGLFLVGDIRDIAAAGTRIAGSGGREGWDDLAWSALGVIPVAGDALKNLKYSDEAIALLARKFLKSNRNTADFLPVAGDRVLETLAKQRMDNLAVGRFDNVDSLQSVGKQDNAAIVYHAVKNSDEYMKSIKVELESLPYNRRGEIAEKAMDHYMLNDRGLQSISDIGPNDVGYRLTANGIDGVYQNALTGEITIVEAKFTTQLNNLGFSKLCPSTPCQMSDAWLDGALRRTVSAGKISEETARKIRAASEAGTLRKEVVVVRDGHSGHTVSEGLTLDDELGAAANMGGIAQHTIVELPRGTVPEP